MYVMQVERGGPIAMYSGHVWFPQLGATAWTIPRGFKVLLPGSEYARLLGNPEGQGDGS